MTAYDRVAKSIDRINDIVLDRLTDKEAREVMAREAEILMAVAEIDRPNWPRSEDQR